ncbi:MAG: CehA/McbA family metallohydrolase [Planctomycetota bacterium]
MIAGLEHPFRALVLATVLLSGCAGVEPYHLYFGDMHGHTELSDGKGSVQDYFAHARDVSALDFAIVTDHDFGNAAPWRMSQETWTETQTTADENTEDGRFIAIAGYEWTSQPKYWDHVDAEGNREAIFEGSPRFYNHKNVYFPSPVTDIFRSKDAAYNSPDRLAAAVEREGGLIHDNHPTQGLAGRDQWDYTQESGSVIVNTEIGADTVLYQGETYQTGMEQLVRDLLDRGGRAGFVGGSDTHEGRPSARTAVYATELTREGVFEALRKRRNYAVSNARILLDFRINGHFMGEEVEIEGKPRLRVAVEGTDRIKEVAVIKDGSVLMSKSGVGKAVSFEHVDDTFDGAGYYYVRVTQVDLDEHGNPSRAWSSPIWVRETKERP